MTAVRWGTVTLTNDPTPLLLAFAAHHLRQGAAEVNLCLDIPNPEFTALAVRQPRIRVWTCDGAFWKTANGGVRPEDVRARQICVAQHVFRHTGCDWLAHIDSDEYMVRVKQITRFLASRPPEVLAVSLPNAERVEWRGVAPRQVLGGLFRKPFAHGEEARAATIYGETAAAWLHRGFSGYAEGKSFYRVGAPIAPGLHQPLPRQDWVNNPARQVFSRIGLLHFDSYTQAHWRRKLWARVVKGVMQEKDNPGRRRQIGDAHDRRNDPAGLAALHAATRTLTSGQLLRLGLARKILPLRFDIRPALAAIWPDLEIDLSRQAIDRALGTGPQTEPQTQRKTGPA